VHVIDTGPGARLDSVTGVGAGTGRDVVLGASLDSRVGVLVSTATAALVGTGTGLGTDGWTAAAAATTAGAGATGAGTGARIVDTAGAGVVVAAEGAVTPTVVLAALSAFRPSPADEDEDDPDAAPGDVDRVRLGGMRGLARVCVYRTARVPVHIHTRSNAMAAAPEPARRKPHPIQTGIVLTRQQQRAIRAARTSPLVYITGEPGTGKTVVLRELYKQLVIAQPGKVVVVASTGTAAENMGIAGASTLHAAFGLGIGNRPARDVVKYMKRERRDTVTRATHVILDEVSMVDDPLFTLWEEVCRLVRKNHQPFGGLCVTIFGDLRQLKPVPRKQGDAAQFCVFGKRWSECNFKHVMLTTPQRQAGDPFFLSILRDMAEGGPNNDGRLRPATLRALEDRSMLEPPTEGPGAPVFLFPTRNEVDAYNNDQLRALTTRGKRYEASDWWPGKAKDGEDDDGDDESVRAEQKANEFFERCKLPASVFIKIGARVMLTWNVAVDEGLVNGSRGVVVGIQPDGAPLVHFDNWTAPIPVPRQEEVLEGRKKDEILARRTQYPLCLCWAMTIHKAQGITSPICVDLTRAFTPEQMLVALSRARRLDDVYIRGRLPRIMPPDARVLTFHEELAVQAHIDNAEDKDPGRAPDSPATGPATKPSKRYKRA
jgi:hypothetical protein